jgi:hypothetical protein
MSVCAHVTTWEPLNGFVKISHWGDLLKYINTFWFLLISGKSDGHVFVRAEMTGWRIPRFPRESPRGVTIQTHDQVGDSAEMALLPSETGAKTHGHIKVIGSRRLWCHRRHSQRLKVNLWRSCQNSYVMRTFPNLLEFFPKRPILSCSCVCMPLICKFRTLDLRVVRSECHAIGGHPPSLHFNSLALVTPKWRPYEHMRYWLHGINILYCDATK